MYGNIIQSVLAHIIKIYHKSSIRKVYPLQKVFARDWDKQHSHRDKRTSAEISVLFIEIAHIAVFFGYRFYLRDSHTVTCTVGFGRFQFGIYIKTEALILFFTRIVSYPLRCEITTYNSGEFSFSQASIALSRIFESSAEKSRLSIFLKDRFSISALTEMPFSRAMFSFSLSI